MKKIIIDNSKNNVKIFCVKVNKDKLLGDYSNIKTSSDELLSAIKLIIFSINKIRIIDKNYINDEEYIFYIDNKEIIDLIKNETDFLIKILPEYHLLYNNVTVSEIGRLLSMLSKFNSKDILFLNNSKDYNLKCKREELYSRQSYCDTTTQDILHKIQNTDLSALSFDEALELLYKIKNIRIERCLVKQEIKMLNDLITK